MIIFLIVIAHAIIINDKLRSALHHIPFHWTYDMLMMRKTTLMMRIGREELLKRERLWLGDDNRANFLIHQIKSYEFSNISRLASDELFNAMAFIRHARWKLDIFICWNSNLERLLERARKELLVQKICIIPTVCNISTSSVQREENFNEMGLKRIFLSLKSEGIHTPATQELISKAYQGDFATV